MSVVDTSFGFDGVVESLRLQTKRIALSRNRCWR